MVGFLARFRSFDIVGGVYPPGAGHVLHLHTLDWPPWKYRDGRGLTSILLGKPRTAQFPSTALWFCAQGRLIHFGFIHISWGCFQNLLQVIMPQAPHPSLMFCGVRGSSATDSIFPQSGAILTRGGSALRVCLFTLVSHAFLPAGKLISGSYLNH